MTTNKSVLNHTSDATMKGRVLAALGGQAKGFKATATLDLSVGVLTDGDTFKLGGSQFEYQDHSTAETATGSTASATASLVTLNQAPDRDFVVGETFGIGAEYVKVTSHNAGSTEVFVERGYAGSTAATHSGATVTRIAAARLPLNGNIVIPVNDLTQAEAETKTIAALPALAPKYTARDGGTNIVLIDAPYSDAYPANSIVSGNSNTLSNFAGGADAINFERAHFKYVVTAADVTAGSIDFPLEFSPEGAAVTIYDDGTKAELAWDGALTVSGAVVTIDNAGATDWAAGDVVVVEAYA